MVFEQQLKKWKEINYKTLLLHVVYTIHLHYHRQQLKYHLHIYHKREAQDEMSTPLDRQDRPYLLLIQFFEDQNLKELHHLPLTQETRCSFCFFLFITNAYGQQTACLTLGNECQHLQSHAKKEKKVLKPLGLGTQVVLMTWVELLDKTEALEERTTDS